MWYEHLPAGTVHGRSWDMYTAFVLILVHSTHHSTRELHELCRAMPDHRHVTHPSFASSPHRILAATIVIARTSIYIDQAQSDPSLI